MEYKYREVICPYCQHRFMFSNNREGLSCRLCLCQYVSKDPNVPKEYVQSADCPKCGKEMFVREHILEGYLYEELAGGCITNRFMGED